jgi:TetR/AcrR family transcriptional regulator
MSHQVEHEKRKMTILRKAMDVFYAEGYANTTFQKISDRCGISRPILYLYFPNKKTIFRGCILVILHEIENRFRKTMADDSLNTTQKLVALSNILVDRFMEERGLFNVLLEYFYILRSKGDTPRTRVLHMTAGARKVYTALIREGIRKGDLKNCNPNQIYQAIFSLFEAATLRLAILGEDNVEDIKFAISLVIHAIEAPQASNGSTSAS